MTLSPVIEPKIAMTSSFLQYSKFQFSFFSLQKIKFMFLSVSLAYKKKSHIIAASGTSAKYWTINSWDQTKIPKPFSTIHIQFSDPYNGVLNKENEGDSK